VQTAVPFELVQVAWESQPPLFVAQGPLVSAVQVMPFPTKPPLQEHMT
jgi:hypothetical protein